MARERAWWCGTCRAYTPAARRRCQRCGRVAEPGTPVTMVDLAEQDPPAEPGVDPGFHTATARRAGRYPALARMCQLYRFTGTVQLVTAIVAVPTGLYLAMAQRTPAPAVTAIGAIAAFVGGMWSAQISFTIAELAQLAIDLEENTRRGARD